MQFGKSKYSISDTFKLNYDVFHVDNIVKLYLNEKFDRGKNLIDKYHELYNSNNSNNSNNYMTIVERINLQDSLKKLKDQLIEIYPESIILNLTSSDTKTNIMPIIENITNSTIENYQSESKYYLLIIKGLNDYIHTNKKPNFIHFLEREFYIDYNATSNNITKLYNSESFCEEPNHSLLKLKSNSNINISNEIYTYVSKSIVLMDDLKTLKYIKSDIIVDYIYIAKKYNPAIRITRELQYKNKCYCNIWYKHLPIDETGKHVCSCGFEAEEIKSDYFFDKTISKKAKDNFRKAFNLLQGNIKPPHYDSVILKLDKYFEKYSIDIKKMISTKEYTSTGKIKGTTRDMLITALKKINQSSHIIYINYYLREYFHWNIKKYNHIEDKVMMLYDETISWFVKVKDPGRNSAPNVWYHLLWLLLEIGEECYLEDFKIPENDSLVELENYRKKICSMRHLHFIPIMSMVKN